MPTLLCVGLGYCARSYVVEFGSRFDRVVGTTRSEERAAALGRESLGGRSVEMLLFDAASRQLTAAIAPADALLISAAPADGRDPVLAAFADEITISRRLAFTVTAAAPGSMRRRRSFRRMPAAVTPASMRSSPGKRWEHGGRYR
jgi:hypothetical protein